MNWLSNLNLSGLELKLQPRGDEVLLEKVSLVSASDIWYFRQIAFLKRQHQVDRPNAVSEQKRLTFFRLERDTRKISPIFVEFCLCASDLGAFYIQFNGPENVFFLLIMFLPDLQGN